MKLFICSFFLFGTLILIQAQTISYKFSLKNHLDVDLVDYTAEVPLSSVNDLPLGDYISNDGVTDVSVEVVSDIKGKGFLIFPITKLKAHEEKTFYIQNGSVPADFMHIEGNNGYTMNVF